MRKATLFNIKQSVIRWASLLIFVLGASLQAQAQDCPPVTVFCQDLHTSFMADACMVEVWAKDFISKINNHETSLDDYIISFEEDSEVMSRIYESVDGNSYQVTIWVTSRCDASLKTRCVVTLDINDNTGMCPTTSCPVDPNPWCGYAVVTCTTVLNSPNAEIGHVAAIIDLRKNSEAPRGDDWSNPVSSNINAVTIHRPDAYRISNLGNVFGATLNPRNGKIFLAASDVYEFDFHQFMVGPAPPSVAGPGGSAGIYVSSFGTPEDNAVLTGTTSIYPSQANFNSTIINKAFIPNTGNIPNDIAKSGNGIGNIDYDLNSNHLFASNLEDGKIYSVNATTGLISAVFDPLTPYSHTAGIVQQSERVWAVQVSDCGNQSKLFFAVESTSTPLIKVKNIYSVELNSDGTFAGTETLEFSVPMGMQSKFTDISISQDCNKLLFAERGHPHKAGVFEYQNVNGSWFFSKQFFAGIYDLDAPAQPQGNILGTSSTGGVTYGPGESDLVIDSECDALVWANTNCGEISSNDERCSIYGAQGISSEGNDVATNKSTDIFINFNPDATIEPELFKAGIGDIEIYNCCCPSDEGQQTIVEGRSNIGGRINSQSANPVNNVSVSLSSSTMNRSIKTNTNGEYAFDNLRMDQEYMIVPEFNDDPLDGISTLDLLLIQRHILGLKKFTKPHNYLAADVNSSGSITSSDLVELRSLLLGRISEFKSSKTWDFIPTKILTESDPSSIYESVENYIRLKEGTESSMSNDFVAIKTGDINLDNKVESLVSIRATKEINLAYQFNSPDASSDIQRVEIFVNEDIELSGTQLSLKYTGNIYDVSSSLEGFSESNYSVNDGNIVISWNHSYSQVISSENPIFTLYLEKGSSKISLSNGSFSSELYNEDLEKISIGLEKKESELFSLGLRVIPNPIDNLGSIIFDMPESGKALIEIYSIDGTRVFKKESVFQKGEQVLLISAEQFETSGMFIAKVKTNDSFSITQFVIIE